MSVKISRREEKRDTSLRDFLLAATLPLLLTGLIGYLIGQTGKIDAGVSSDELTALEERAKTAERGYGEMLWLGHQMDSIRQLIITGAKDLDGEWLTAANQQGTPTFGLDPLAEWFGKVNANHRSLSNGIAKIKGIAQGNGILLTEQIEYLTKPVTLLNDKHRNAFQYQMQSYSGQNKEGKEMLDMVQEQQQDFDEQKEDFESKLKVKDEIIRLKDERIAALNEANSKGQAPPPVSYVTQKGKVKSAVNEIRGAIGRIPDGIFANKNKRAELETQINNQLIEIETAIGSIN